MNTIIKCNVKSNVGSVASKGPVWSKGLQRTRHELDAKGEHVEGSIVDLKRYDGYTIALLDSGQRIAFTLSMVKVLCPIVGKRVDYRGAFAKHSERLGTYYVACSRCKIV